MSKRWKLGLWLLSIVVMSLGQGVLASENAETNPSYENDFVLRSDRLENGERTNAGDSGASSDLFSDEMTQKVEAHEKSRQNAQKDVGNRIFSRKETKAEVLDTNKLFAEGEERIVYASSDQVGEEDQAETSLLLFGLLGVLLLAGVTYVSYLFLRGAG